MALPCKLPPATSGLATEHNGQTAVPQGSRGGARSTAPAYPRRSGDFHAINDVFVHPADWPILRHNGLDRLEAFFALAAGDSLSKPGLRAWRERKRVVLSDEFGRQQTYFLKRYSRPPLVLQVRRLLGGSSRGSGPLEADNAGALRAAGLRTYRVAAFGQQSNVGFEQRSFILMAALGGESLERWWPAQRERLYGDSQFAWRVSLIGEVAGFVARFHAAGFVHRDLYAAHLFIDTNAPPGRRFSLIDLGRVFRPHLRRRRWVLKDLAELDFSASLAGVTRCDRLRFLRVYLGASAEADRRRRHYLARRITAKSRQIAAHHHRRHASGPPDDAG